MKTAILEELFNKRLGAIKPGLDRMNKAYEILGKPCSDQTNIIVGGTNGKGGTASFIHALSTKKSALFSSPHLISYTERFQIEQHQVTDQELERSFHSIKDKLGTLYEELSFFELTTLIGMTLFHQHRTAENIFEVGMGGKWDSTNVVTPSLAVITSVSRDHQEFLGESLPEILEQKLGITRPGKPLFWGGGGEAEGHEGCEQILIKHTRAHNIPLYRWGVDFGIADQRIFIGNSGQKHWLDIPVLLSKSPSYILRNFVLALAVRQYLDQPHHVTITGPSIDRQLKQKRCPIPMIGRFQRCHFEGKRLLLDVCHNPDGMLNLCKNISQRQPEKAVALISILKDKKIDEMLDLACETFQRVILFQIDNPRTFQAASLSERHRHLNFFANFADAWQHVSQTSASSPIVVCGSVLAIGKVFEYIGKEPIQHSCSDILLGDWP